MMRRIANPLRRLPNSIALMVGACAVALFGSVTVASIASAGQGTTDTDSADNTDFPAEVSEEPAEGSIGPSAGQEWFDSPDGQAFLDLRDAGYMRIGLPGAGLKSGLVSLEFFESAPLGEVAELIDEESGQIVGYYISQAGPVDAESAEQLNFDWERVLREVTFQHDQEHADSLVAAIEARGGFGTVRETPALNQ